MNKKMRWYKEAVPGQSVNAVSIRAGIPQASLNRRVRDGALTCEDVLAIARAFGVGVVKSLVDTGYVTRAEVQQYAVSAAVSDATDREIADEVWKRMVEGRLDADGEPAMSVIEDINSGGAEPLAALQSRRNEEFERREE